MSWLLIICFIVLLVLWYWTRPVTTAFRYEDYGSLIDPVSMTRVPVCSYRGRDLMKKYMTCYFNEYLYQTKNDWNYILPTELYHELFMNREKDYFLLDVRKPTDYNAGHIPSSVNIYWLTLMRPENLAKLPKNRDIIIICYVGHTASQILVLLKMLGFRARVLKFGMGTSPQPKIPVKGWSKYGFPVRKIM